MSAGHVDIITDPNFEHPLLGPGNELRPRTHRCTSCRAEAKFKSAATCADCRDCGGVRTMRGVVDVTVLAMLLSRN